MKQGNIKSYYSLLFLIFIILWSTWALTKTALRTLADAILMIVGDFDDLLSLGQLACQPKLTEHILFFGRVPLKDVHPYDEIVDVFVDPVYDDDTVKRHAPLTLLVRCICGVPFVKENVADRAVLISESPEDLLVSPEGTEAQAKEILDVHVNVERVARYIQRGKNASKNIIGMSWRANLNLFVKP